MKQFQSRFSLLLALLLLWWTPPAAQAASTQPETPAGVEFRLDQQGEVYEVYLRPQITPEFPNLTLTAQVTIKVPHGTAAERFLVANEQSPLAGVEWSQTSRIDAPAEDPAADYLSFTVDFTGGDHRLYQWAAGQEIKVFSFVNQGGCVVGGAIQLLPPDDPFTQLPNSASANPGNQITILGLEADNAYSGNYGNSSLTCLPSAQQPMPRLFLPLVAR